MDDAVLANMYDELVQQSPTLPPVGRVAGRGAEPGAGGIPEDRVRYHVCFGSWHVPHVADAPLDAIVDLMLRCGRAPT